MTKQAIKIPCNFAHVVGYNKETQVPILHECRKSARYHIQGTDASVHNYCETHVRRIRQSTSPATFEAIV